MRPIKILSILVCMILAIPPSFNTATHLLENGSSCTKELDNSLGYNHFEESSIRVTIKRIRTLNITIDNPPSFAITIHTGAQGWESNTLSGFDILNIGVAQFDIPDNEQDITITIRVLKNGEQADIASDGKTLEVTYDVLRGDWDGEDTRGDDTGYGHTSGHEDGTINETDCELWFDITCNDPDGDGLTSWEEINIYGTNPETNDVGRDDDTDTLPIEWEDHWGYDPFTAEDHRTLDPDMDGIQNTEEHYMEEWFADPFRQDIFIENDYIEPYNGIEAIMPEESLEFQYSAFTQHNILLLVDDGLMGGSDVIPYENLEDRDACDNLYNTYFLHNDTNNSRRGIFHYALIIHEYDAFGRGVGGFNFRRDAFAIASAYIQKWRPWSEGMVLGHGGSYMHELGHQLGLDHLKVFPWQLLYWLSGNYKSCMNYRYNFNIIDYSEGTNGFMDRDEWGTLDLLHFQR